MIYLLIYCLNALVYLLPLLTFLPFHISLLNKISIYIIILGNIFIMVYCIGNIGVVFLLLSVSLFLSFLDTHRLRNVCLFFASYMFCVFWDNLFTVLWNILGFPITDILRQNTALYITYTVLYTLLLFLLSKLLVWGIHKIIIPKNYAVIPKEVWGAIFINLLICLIIFVFNIVVGERIGYNKNIIVFNCILFGFYMMVSTISILNSIKTYIVKSDMQSKQDAYDTLQKYTQQIETMYSDIRSFKHDYLNIMASMSGFIEEGDMSGLTQYFSKSIVPLSSQINKSNYKLNQLMNIKISEIKSIISAKITYAHEIGVEVNVEIIDPIYTIPMGTLDLARVLGIFLDNAIEGALETDTPTISFAMINNIGSVTIIILNNYIKHNIPYYDLKKISISTKGKNRGIGLHNAENILSKYPNIVHDTEMKDHEFIQRLEIFK